MDGIGDDGAGDADALLLAARHFARLVRRAVGQAHHVQRGTRHGPALGADEMVSSNGNSTLAAADSIGIRL